MNVKKILSIFILGLFLVSFGYCADYTISQFKIGDEIYSLNEDGYFYSSTGDRISVSGQTGIEAYINRNIESNNLISITYNDYDAAYHSSYTDKANIYVVDSESKGNKELVSSVSDDSSKDNDVKKELGDIEEQINNNDNAEELQKTLEEIKQQIANEENQKAIQEAIQELKKQITSAETDDRSSIVSTDLNPEQDELNNKLNSLKSSDICSKLAEEIQDLEAEISGTYSGNIYEGTSKADLEKKINEIENKKEILDNPTSNLDEYKKLVNSGYHESSTGANIIFKKYVEATDNKNTICNNEPNSDNCKNAIKELEKYSSTLKLMSNANIAYVYQQGFSNAKTKDEQEKYISIYIKEQCSDAYFESLCNALSFESQATIQKKQILDSISEATKGKTSKDEYNNAIYKTLKDNYGIKVENQKELAKELETAQSELDSCTENCDTLRAKLEVIKAAYGQTKVETNALYSILYAIKNPDKNALKAAKLFGFEADYSNLPTMLGETFPSQICLDKIDGYLDKEVENNGGITKYNDNISGIEALADLRAQRSAITPDNKTQVTYSYYVKDPEEPFSLSIKYVQNGDWKTFVIENSSSSKGYDSVAIPLNTIDGIETSSFTINLDTGDIHLTYPIVLMSTSALSNTIENTGNSQGNEEAIINNNING